MPAYVLGPALSFYRVYARLGFVVAIAAAVLAAFMLARIAARRKGKLAVAALIALVAFELAPTAWTRWRSVPRRHTTAG